MTENSLTAEDIPAEAGDSFTTADGQADSSDVINEIVESVDNDYLIVGEVLEAVITSPDLNSTSPTTTTQIVDEITSNRTSEPDDKVQDQDTVLPAKEDDQQARVDMMEVEEEDGGAVVKETQSEKEQQRKETEGDKDKVVEEKVEEKVYDDDDDDDDDDEVQEIEMEHLEKEPGQPVTDARVLEEIISGDGEIVEGLGPEFVIERVVDKKVTNDGKALYLVKWQNYSSRENTWEPLEHLVECDKTVQQFELARARMVAERFDEERAGKAKNANGPANGQAAPRRRPMSGIRHKDLEVLDVMGLTKVDQENYFLVTIANSTQKAFIRESIANRVIPNKVIDFYIKNLQWKAVSSPEVKNAYSQ